jgi:predicted DNA-binding transcriptional regulator AlpA
MGSRREGTGPPRSLLTIDQVADWLQIPKNTLYRQHSQGTPPGSLGVRVGRYLRYDRATIQDWLDRGGPE